MLRLMKYSACILAATMYYAAPANAQATRTWVSGVGDDVNPCSRTAPCKTFAGAISKTAAGGEINCLDPGGFGTVTITKSITIDCTGTFGSVLASGINGINVNDSASGFPNTIVVIIRGISINGAGGGAQNANGNPGSGVIGINFTSGASLTVEDVLIQRFNTSTAVGIRFAPAGAARLTVHNTVITNNGFGSAGGGLLVSPTGASGNARVVIDNVNFALNANNAVRVDTTGNTSASGVVMDIANSQLSGSSNGLSLNTPVGTTFAVANIVNSSIFSNPGNALAVNGSASTIRAGNNLITSNGFVTSIAGGGTIKSYGDNIIDGNSNPAAFTPPNLTRG